MTLLSCFEPMSSDLKHQMASANSCDSVKSMISKALSKLVDFDNDYRQSITEQEDLMLSAIIKRSPLFSSDKQWLDAYLHAAQSIDGDSSRIVTQCAITGASVGLAIGSLSHRVVPTVLTSVLLGSAAYVVANMHFQKKDSPEVVPSIDVDGIMSYISSNLESIDELMSVFSAQIARVRISCSE